MNLWLPPLPLSFVLTDDGGSFRHFSDNQTGIPLSPHPGAFGVKRKNHTHEGVDLYCPEGTTVSAVEDGVIVAVLPFTGEHAGLPWWKNTFALLVEGESGVVVYGEIMPSKSLLLGDGVSAGEHLGTIARVLKNDKGRPMCMLHLELHTPGARFTPPWYEEKPPTLLDPTPFLMPLASR